MRLRLASAVRVPVAAAAVAVSAVLALSGCAGSGVQRQAPGAAQSSVRTSSDGTDLSLEGRNVDLQISKAAVHLAAPGGAQLEMKVTNAGPVAEHLAVASVGPHVANVTGSAANPLSVAGVLIEGYNGTAQFGAAGGPEITLPAGDAPKAGSTVTVMLQFGVAGMVRLDVPVLAK
jgi:hypothetical protein